MIVYSFSFVASVLFANWADAQLKLRDDPSRVPRRFAVGAFFVFLVLAGVSALRWRVGTDYWTYDRNYEDYVQEFLDGPQLLGEPGIRLLAWVSHSLGAGSAGMFALAAIITMGLFVRTLWRWSPAFALSIAILILSGVWHGSFNGVRQYLACAILFAGHRFVIDRKPVKWGFVVLLASLFHISALVAILLYFIPTKQTSFRSQTLVVVLGLIGMFGFGSILGLIEAATGDVGLSGGSYANRSVNPLRIAFAFFPIGLYWFLENRNAVRATEAWFYINMMVVYAATYLASANSAYLARFSIYLTPFLAIGLVSITSVPNRTERILIRGATIIVFATFLYIDIVDTRNLVNFQWIFNRQ